MDYQVNFISKLKSVINVFLKETFKLIKLDTKLRDLTMIKNFEIFK